MGKNSVQKVNNENGKQRWKEIQQWKKPNDARRGNSPIKERGARTLKKKKEVISAVKNEQCRGYKKKKLNIKNVTGKIFRDKVYYQTSWEPRRENKIALYNM